MLALPVGVIEAQVKGDLKKCVKRFFRSSGSSLCAGYSFGQRLTGGVSGSGHRPGTGKTISDVKASVVSKDRGTKADVVSNSEGLIVVPDLAPGDYQLALQHDGFRTINANFTIRVGVNTSLDLKMELGAVASSVIVEINTVTVDTDKSTVQGIIQGDQIDALPLNGRNFLDLAQQAPGVQVVDGGSFDPTKNQFTGVSVGGRSGRSTRIQVDGVDITDETVGTTVMNISNESINEFGIAQSSLDVSTDLTSTGAVADFQDWNQLHPRIGFWFLASLGICGQQWPVECPRPAQATFLSGTTTVVG